MRTQLKVLQQARVNGKENSPVNDLLLQLHALSHSIHVPAGGYESRECVRECIYAFNFLRLVFLLVYWWLKMKLFLVGWKKGRGVGWVGSRLGALFVVFVHVGQSRRQLHQDLERGWRREGGN